MNVTKSESLTEDKKKMLREFYETLLAETSSAVARIAEKSGYSRAYIYRFFNGDYHISIENQKILDIGIGLIEEDIKNKTEANGDQKKENEIIAKKLAEAKSLKPLTDF